MAEAGLEMVDKIGYLLLKKGIIDIPLLENALKTKKEDSGRRRNLAQILVQDFKLDFDTIFREVALLYAFPEINMREDDFKAENLEKIKKLYESWDETLRTKMEENLVLPFRWLDAQKIKLVLAVCDPTSRALAGIANQMQLKKYEIRYLPKKDYDRIMEFISPDENEFLKVMEEAEAEITIAPDESGIDEEQLDEEINKSALISLIEAALIEGVRKGVSDIHIVPGSGNTTEIHFRVDGKLMLWHTQRNTLPEAVAAVVKDRSRGMDRFERERAQDGFIQREIDKNLIRFRVSVLPMVGTELKNKFETIVIRILDDRKVIRDLDKLGLTGYAKTAFQKSISKPQGMVILTGPTGSGKSTTLIAALYQVIDPTKNVLTVEDPVEYIIEGARQLKIGYRMDFEQAIRSILRHDPDIVLVGEMRDKITAETAIKLANTGHLTFSTLHTNDAPSAVARLYKMGIEPFLIAYAINIIVAQRLIRKICMKCRREITPDEQLLKTAGLDISFFEGNPVYEPVGCPECNNTGYKGRMAIHEALYFTPEIREIVVRSGKDVDENAIRIQSRKDGTHTLRMSGFEKVKKGLTSIQEVLAGTTED